jgi:hypothetical protein
MAVFFICSLPLRSDLFAGELARHGCFASSLREAKHARAATFKKSFQAGRMELG